MEDVRVAADACKLTGTTAKCAIKNHELFLCFDQENASMFQSEKRMVLGLAMGLVMGLTTPAPAAAELVGEVTRKPLLLRAWEGERT